MVKMRAGAGSEERGCALAGLFLVCCFDIPLPPSKGGIFSPKILCENYVYISGSNYLLCRY